MKQDVINLCIDQASYTLRSVNDEFVDFVRELGGAEHLPKQFTLNVPEMTKLERQIDKAVVEGNLRRTEDLCDEYKKRFSNYIAAWRKKVAKGVSV